MNHLLTSLDYPDPDVIRVDDTYYMVSTTMHFLPGGEILRSYDLLHWERVGYVFAQLEDDPCHRLEDGRGFYGKGMWAASLRYHSGTFYVCFVANETGKTYLFRSTQITGPWTRSEVAGFYHDPSLLFDGDRVFIAWGNTEVRITELESDLSGPKADGLDRVAVRESGNPFLGYEGCHFYKIRGRYYLFLIHSLPSRWRRVEACFWADSIEGEFQGGDVLDDDRGYGDHGTAQGGLVETPGGDWWAILFQDHGAVGRIPVLVPVTWEGPRPVFGTSGGAPQDLRPGHRYEPLVGDDDFRGPLNPAWQWNHNPHHTLWRLDSARGQLRLRSGSLAADLTQALNTLTQRMRFPGCTAEVTVDGRDLATGDHAGLVALQSAFGAIALARTSEGWALRTLDPSGTRESVPIPGPEARLRVEVWFSAEKDRATFWYFQDGWRRLGGDHGLKFQLDHFVGCRFGLFLWSTQTVGGEAGFSGFRYTETGL